MARPVGWTVFLLECADGTYFGGMTRNLEFELSQINISRRGVYFSAHPERVPAKVVFSETRLPFKEAYIKKTYLMEMNRRLRKKLVETGRWPLGRIMRKFVVDTDPLDMVK